MQLIENNNVAIIIAHPDDETLWAGGTILMHPTWKFFVVCLCRSNDEERSSKFYKALKTLNAEGKMGDLDDGPEQIPLHEKEVQDEILKLLPPINFSIIITHNPSGEYTKNLRHEEISRAVINLWHEGKIMAHKLWTFAYEDAEKLYLPKAVENASIFVTLPKNVWEYKHDIICKTYGFGIESWEAETTPKSEAFWQFPNSFDAQLWLQKFKATNSTEHHTT